MEPEALYRTKPKTGLPPLVQSYMEKAKVKMKTIRRFHADSSLAVVKELKDDKIYARNLTGVCVYAAETSTPKTAW